MVGETLKMEKTEALHIYGWFTLAFIFSQILGALLGDLLIGNKKSILIGGIIQALGAFMLCWPSTTGLYVGLLLVVLGNGFFTPNIISNFGKTYLNKTKLLDSGFTIFYFAINLGSLLGVLLIGYLGKTYGYNIGFITSGLLMLISIIPVFLSKENRLDDIEKIDSPISNRILNIFIAFIVIGLFWGFYELSSMYIFNVQIQLRQVSALGIPNHLWESINSIFILLVSLIAIVLWRYYYSNQFFKLMLGFMFAVISFGILFFIPEVPTEQHTTTYLISLLFLAISEIHIAPIINSILTKYANPKYLAILISLSFLPTRLISSFFGLFNDKLYYNPILGLKIGTIGMTVVGIGLVGYVMIHKKNKSTTS